MSSVRYNIGGRVYPRFRIVQGNIYPWALRGSGGVTPVHATLDYRRHRMGWYFLADGVANIFRWPCYGSGGTPPATTQIPWSGFASNVGRMMMRRG